MGLLGDLPDRQIPESSGTTDHDGRGYIERHHLERVIRDIDYISEVLSHGVSRHEPMPPAGARKTTSEAIDVSDLSLADVWRAVIRLKLSSIVLLIGILVTGGAALVGIVKGRYEPKLAEISAFSDAFAIQFADREVLEQVVTGVLEEKPDGLITYDEALGALLWQVKSQAGFAEFLSGERKTTVQVTFQGDSVEFEWAYGPNPLLYILPKIGLAPTEDRLAEFNAKLNLFGVAWVDEANRIVRSTEGGLAVVGGGD